jgi:hypothetical protein
MFIKKVSSQPSQLAPWELGLVNGVTVQSVNLASPTQFSPFGSVVVNFMHPIHGRLSSYMNLPNLETLVSDYQQYEEYMNTPKDQRGLLDPTVRRNLKDMGQLLSAIMQFSIAGGQFNEALIAVDFNYVNTYDGAYFKDMLTDLAQNLTEVSIFTFIQPGKEKVILYPYSAQILTSDGRYPVEKFFAMFGPEATVKGTSLVNGYQQVEVQDGSFTTKISYKA